MQQNSPPVFLARVSVVVAREDTANGRESQTRLREEMDLYHQPEDIIATSIDGLQIKAAAYISEAIDKIKDPGPTSIGSACFMSDKAKIGSSNYAS